MDKKQASEWSRGGRRTIETKYEGRQGIITKAARTCFERRGVAKTSIADITREVNITRELFYYYFANKGAVVDAVMDTFVADGQRLLASSLEESDKGDYQTAPLMSLVAVIRALRAWVQTDADAQQPMGELLRETGRWPQVAYRVADRAVAALQECDALLPGEHLAARARGLRTALIGVMMVQQVNGEVSDEQLAVEIAPLLG